MRIVWKGVGSALGPWFLPYGFLSAIPVPIDARSLETKRITTTTCSCSYIEECSILLREDVCVASIRAIDYE